MSTRKDYETVAGVIAASFVANDEKTYLGSVTRDFCSATIDALAFRMASAFHADNPRFDVTQFLAACGMRADLIGDYADLIAPANVKG